MVSEQVATIVGALIGCVAFTAGFFINLAGRETGTFWFGVRFERDGDQVFFWFAQTLNAVAAVACAIAVVWVLFNGSPQ